MSTFVQLLKSVGAIPRSEEYKVGDLIISNVDGRPAVIVAVVPQKEKFKVKVAYKDKDEIGFLNPAEVKHAT